MPKEEIMKEQKKIVFYHFIEQSPQATPGGIRAVGSNMVVNIRGGEVHRDSRGAKHVTEYRDVKFLKGVLEVDAGDTEVIETIRKLMEHDRTITESEDAFLAAIAAPATKAKLLEKNDALKKENVDLKEKNLALAAKLNELKLGVAEEKLAEVLTKPAAAGA